MAAQKDQSVRPPFPLDSLAPIAIIAANVAVFFYLWRHGFPAALIERFVMTSEKLVRGDFAPLFTTGFLHRDFSHLAFNMVGIFIFGRVVQQQFGVIKTLLIYTGALVVSMCTGMIIYTYVLHKNIAVIGASGALMGLISCAMLAAPFRITYEMFVPLPVMVEAWIFFYADMQGLLGGERDGVSHVVHLCGFLSVGVIVYLLDKRERDILRKGFLVNVFSFVLFLWINYWITVHAPGFSLLRFLRTII